MVLCACGKEDVDVLVLDYGSPATAKVVDRLIELGVNYQVSDEDLTIEQIKKINPKGIITSGSPASVLDPDSPRPPVAIYEMGVPILGLCYGMQLMASQLGGQVVHCETPEDGLIDKVNITGKCDIIPDGIKDINVWYFHEDCVISMPSDFQIVGYSKNTPMAIACNHKKKLYGMQFHPERFDKTPETVQIIDTFITKVVLGVETPRTLEDSYRQVKDLIDTLDVATTTVLDLSGKNLKAIPENIGRLKNLKKLTLNRNPLETLPSEIGLLKNLTYLAIYDSSLKELPAEIGELSNLTYLAIYGSQITELPAEIGKLVQLKLLALDNNKLKKLPPEIGSLKKLEMIFLNFNDLYELPVEIGQMTRMVEFKAPGNKFKKLPEEIQNLKEMVLLDVSSNRLNQLPEGFENLSSLKYLFLRNNELISLPANMDKMKSLDTLYIDGNPMLPNDSATLDLLEKLKLSGKKLK